MAAISGVEPTIARFLSAGGNPDASDGEGRTLLHLAASRGHNTLYRLLLDAGASVSLVDRKGHDAITMALASGSAATTELIAERMKPSEGMASGGNSVTSEASPIPGFFSDVEAFGNDCPASGRLDAGQLPSIPESPVALDLEEGLSADPPQQELAFEGWLGSMASLDKGSHDPGGFQVDAGLQADPPPGTIRPGDVDHLLSMYSRLISKSVGISVQDRHGLRRPGAEVVQRDQSRGTGLNALGAMHMPTEHESRSEGGD